MLDSIKVYRFKKDRKTITLFVDSIKRKSQYWLEVQGLDGSLVLSEKVFSWDAAIGLLESHDWAKYEPEWVDPFFTERVMEAKGIGNVPVKNYNAQERILEVLRRLLSNESINVANATLEFGIENATVQRDIKAIREYLSYSNRDVEYKGRRTGYVLSEQGDYFTIDDALGILLLFYGSRALNKEELKKVSAKIIGLFSPTEQIKMRKFFQSYLYYYQPVQEQNLFELFHTCFQANSQKRVLEFTYTNNQGMTKVREVEPFTITYHDKKYYLHARLIGTAKDSSLIPWKLDRIQDCKITSKRFTLPPEEIDKGDYVQKAFNMYTGDLITVTMKVKDSNLEYLRRNFTDVSIGLMDADSWHVVEVEVYGDMGITLWVLKQGPNVEVIEPVSLRDKVKEEIKKMYQLYFLSEERAPVSTQALLEE
jgi:predicted DNA-binding transcriptional regulator YafY